MKLNIGHSNVTDTTNILDVKVPPEMRIRRQSNIDWINDAFAGGFISSQVVMLTGSSGAGKTTLVYQLGDALTAMGHVVLYNTREESLAQVALRIESMHLKHGFVVAEHRRVPELLEQANRMMAQNPGKQMFLFQDSLPTLDDGFYRDGAMNSKTPERACTKLVEWAKTKSKKGGLWPIVVFINQVTKSGKFAGKNTVLHAIDAHAHVKIDRKTGYRHFNVEKNRMGPNYDTFVVGLAAEGLTLVRKINLVASQEAAGEARAEAADVVDEGNIFDLEAGRRRRSGRRVRLA